MELIGLYLVAAGLLVVAGAAKALRPDDTARALVPLLSVRRPVHGRAFSLRHMRMVVRAGALAEAALGLAALLLPRSVTAALVALSYALFTVVVVIARRRGGPLATCGCFGRPDTPPTTVHLFLDALLAGSAVVIAATARGDGTVISALAHQPWAGLPLLVVSVVGLWLSVLALSALAALEGARLSVRPARSGFARP